MDVQTNATIMMIEIYLRILLSNDDHLKKDPERLRCHIFSGPEYLNDFRSAPYPALGSAAGPIMVRQPQV